MVHYWLHTDEDSSISKEVDIPEASDEEVKSEDEMSADSDAIVMTPSIRPGSTTGQAVSWLKSVVFPKRWKVWIWLWFAGDCVQGVQTKKMVTKLITWNPNQGKLIMRKTYVDFEQNRSLVYFIKLILRCFLSLAYYPSQDWNTLMS